MRIQRINEKIVYPKLSYKICGLLFAIHKSLGRYRSEKQYMDAFEKLLRDNGVNYVREKPLPPSFDGEKERRNIPILLLGTRLLSILKIKIL